MNRTRVLSVLMVLVLIKMVFLGYQNYKLNEELHSRAERVDVVRGVPPMSTAMRNIATAVDAMADMSQQERGEYLERNWPNLDEGIAYFLRGRGMIRRNQDIDRIEFRYGSLDDVRAESADGDRHGYIENQLVAQVYIRGERNPVSVIVECLNGMFALPGDVGELQLVGMHTPIERFTIGPREGLIHHVDFPVAIDLAERFNLPLYRGRSFNRGNQITPDRARELEGTTDRLQVTVHVVEGDRFDLRAMTFTPSPRRRT